MCEHLIFSANTHTSPVIFSIVLELGINLALDSYVYGGCFTEEYLRSARPIGQMDAVE